MFDSINLEQAISDIFDTGVDDDNLVLLYKANCEVDMAVRTSDGLSDRQTVENIVLQGDTWGSILASNQVDMIGKESMEAGHFYLYKNILPVGFLGLVDDIVGITEAGFKAQELNAFINVKTAEKTLQFGPSKCKSMLIGKQLEDIHNSDIQVDSWRVEHFENKQTGVDELVEHFDGKLSIEKTNEQMYLGFVISSQGDNLANICHLKKKSIGVIRKIIDKLNSLNLQKYFFECAMIFMNVILRGSILYACEVYYNLKENELRQIERIEEGYLRQILKTTKGCPITQLYLEVGQIPARFEIQKMRLLFLKYILQQNDESILKKFLNLQFKQKTKGDWASTCLNDLKSLRITETLEEIKSMTKNKFKNILKDRIKENALKYLTEKQGKKGKDIVYKDIQMSEYLSPSNKRLTIEQKRRLFEVRNQMVDIPSNFPTKYTYNKCDCGENENMEHLYQCETLGKKPKLSYEKIYNGSIQEQISVFEIFIEKMNEREKQKSEMLYP